MVGRESERAELAAALGAARHGDGKAALLLGEAGMGKSVLADWLARHARASGMQVARGASAPDGPLWPWQRASPRSRGCGGTATRTSGREVLAAAVVDALAEAARRPRGDRGPPGCDPACCRLRAAMDAASSLPVMLLRTCRDDPLSPRRRSRPARRPARRVRRIALSPIGVHAVADLVGGVVGRTLSDGDVRYLHARPGGNPFFVHEVARLLLAHGPSGALRVPPGVEEVLRRRVARLGQPCATLLATAAVAAESAEDRVETDLLAAVSDCAQAAVAPLVDEAVAARLLDDDPARPAHHHFRHALIREVLVQGLPGAERARLHARVAAALADRPGTSATRLAHHWCRAAVTSRRRAAEWSVHAARGRQPGSGSRTPRPTTPARSRSRRWTGSPS
jgi:hypothetical protein